jgi:hypothetical protein
MATITITPLRKRPLGISVIGIVNFTGGVMTMTSTVMALISSAIEMTAPQYNEVVASELMLASSVMLAIALATIFITVGLLRMKSWAFFAAIVVNLLIVAEAILRFAAGNGGLSGTLLPLAVIVYLAVFARPTYFARPQE